METVTELLRTLASKGVKLSADAGQLNCYAQNGTLTRDMREGIVKYKSEIIALLEDRKKRLEAQLNKPASKKGNDFPLSAGQKGLYILQKIHPEMTAYNLPLCVRIGGDLDVKILEKAWSCVLEQYPILKARIVEKEGTLSHCLDDRCRTTIQQQTVEYADERRLVSFLRQRVKQPFDLDRGPLARIELFSGSGHERFLLLTIHHIIFDGVSAVVLLRTLLAYYQTLFEGKPVKLSPELPGYQEFVAWEETMLESAEGRSHAEYWQERLSGELPAIELFPDMPRLTSPSFEGATLIETLPAELSRGIREFARAQAFLPSVIFLAALKLLLHRYTNQHEIIVGMPVIVRPGQKFSAEVGYFINMVPLRTRCVAALKLSEFLREVRGTMLDAVYHSSYPFELMLDRLRTTQGTKNAVFQVNYAYQNFISDGSFASLSRHQALDIQNVQEIGPEGYSDLGLEIFEKDALFSVHVRYNPQLYTREAIQRFCRHYSALLKSFSQDGDRPLHEYSILPEGEKHRLLVEFNDTRADYPTDKCIHELFRDRVLIAPGKTAAAFGGQELSYRELDHRSSSLALYLQSLGVKPDSVVGLCLERSLEMMVGIMGTVQAGGAYLPLDPDYPDDRLTYMLEDSDAAIILTQERFRERVSALAAPGVTVISLDTEWRKVSAGASALESQGVQLRREVKPNNVCYVIYTSGSTGKPKGVLVEHRALVNRIHWMQKRYLLDAGDVVLQKTPYSFDVSVWEFFWPMMTGASVVFAVPGGHKDVQYLETLIDTAKVTTLHFVPSMLRAFLDNAKARCGSVKRIFASGEALDRKSVERYKTKFPNAVLHNLYGPTEAAIDVTAFDCSQLTYPFVPIGTPIDNIQMYVLDHYNHPQPIGVPGELHIAGDGLARGYLNRPELTQEKFVANPFRPGARMYKTGDLACWLDDGNIQYLGRIDTQVKIRGFRVEIGEIEARLNQYPQVQDSAVIAKGEDADKQLIAFYRTKGTAADHVVQLPNEELRAHLLRTLPDYMVPVAFVSVAAIPLSANGKADRRALARMDVTTVSGQEYVAPRNDMEKQLVDIWAEVLSLAPETIGINDNFFERGGHSLRAAQLISKISAQLGVDLPLKVFFDNGNIAKLARFVETAEKSDVRSIPRLDRTRFDRLPLSFAQERLWFINQLEPDSAGYNLPGAVTISGELDISQLEQAFNLIIARHENLRTIFPSHEGQAHQCILDHVDFKLQRIDLSDYKDNNARGKEARQLCRTEAATPFDLARGPLIRGNVIKLAEHEHIVMLNMHHIISDGWSIGVFINELRVIMNALRRGRRPELPPLRIQYADYGVWQRRWLEEGGVLKRQLAYWQQKLAGVAESLDLATDFPRPSVQSFAGASRMFALDAQLTGRLKRLAEQQGCTLYMLLLAAFKALLYRYTGQNDLCVGSPIANRQYGQTDGLIGMFVNTLALRSQIARDDTFLELLSRVKVTCLEAYENQDAPFEKVVDLLRPQRNLAISPIFQVMLILQNVDMGSPDEHMQRYPLDTGVSKFELTAEFTETREGLDGRIEYSTDLYRPQTIKRMAEHFTALCRAITATPTARIGDLEYLSEAEKNRVLVDFNATQAEYPKSGCLHQLFVEQVARVPGDTAVVCGNKHLTYQQLYAKSQDLALYLQSQGVEPDRLVGVCMDRSLDMVVGLLGILQAGGAYVPLDPEHPDERLAYMVRDSRAEIVLTQDSLCGKLNAVVPSDTRLIALDRQKAEIGNHVAGLKTGNVQLEQKVRPNHLAYVIYTSGSTGQPKGVAIEHHSPVTLVHWASEVYSREELAGVLASTSICFDLSVYEIFVTLANGGTVILARNALGLVDLPNQESVTLINTVPSAMEELVRLGAIPDSVQTINLAGEPLSRALVDRIYDTTSVTKVYDLYGPSEDTTYSTYVLREQDALATIGRPIANTQVYILDPQSHPQPIGVPGELHIAGDGLARGYLNRPELTQEKFVGNPFQSGTRMYKTGDLARWLADGTIQYLGRIDTQVKIRGFRIEMGEIEARLNQYSGIQDSVVVAQGQGASKQLIAFYRARDTQGDRLAQLPSEELRSHLLKTLPDYMVPAAFVSLPAIPLNPNGKVDRRALARMDVTMAAREEYVAPRNDTERRIAAIWAEVLNRAPETIGIRDNFFELGGHSLLATQLISKIRTQLDISLPLKALFERTSVARLAELIATAEKSEIPAIMAVDRAQFGRLPLSFSQERLWFINQLEPDSPGYNLPDAFTIHGDLNVDHLEQAFNLIIARHENLRTVFPNNEGEAEQCVLDHVDFEVERLDISQYTDRNTRDNEARRLCHIEAATLFDLAAGPLMRCKVIKVAEYEHILMLNMHHIISDGWSFVVLLKELHIIMEAQRQGRQPELIPLPIQYVDYSIWQRRWLEEGGILTQQLAYWQKKLRGIPESLNLPTDHSRPSLQSVAGATEAFALDAQLTAQLKRFAEQQGGTLYMVLLAVFNVLLHRYTGEGDICVGTPVANRQYGQTEGLIGMFVNTLALRTDVASDDTFTALLSKVKTTCLGAYENQDAPFEKVVDVLRLQRNLAISPLFQVMLILQNVDTALDQRIERYPLDSGISKFDLTVAFAETPDGLAGTIRYRTALYERHTIERMARHLAALSQAVTDRPNAKLSELDYIDETEKHRLLKDYNNTRAGYPNDKCLHELFAEQTAINPDRPAVVFGEQELTYQELYGKSCDLASYLQARGVKPDSLVGLYAERSVEMVVGLLGILLAGGAYVPLDPDYPAERLQYMLEDAAPAIVLTQERLKARLPQTSAPTIALDSEWAVIEQHARTNPLRRLAGAAPDNLAYVIYTSGSTGVPKGVMVRHSGVVNLCNALAKAVYAGHDGWTRISLNASLSFDSSVKQLVQLLSGRTLIVVPQDVRLDANALLRFIAHHRIDVFDCTPSQLVAMLSAGMFDGTGSIPKAFLLGGEAVDSRLWRLLTEQPDVIFYNVYGPAECTVDATIARITAEEPTPHIGRPIANAQIYILDGHFQPVPVGVVGEIFIGGAGVARGYLNQPDLTAERFIADPFSRDRQARLYKTGDLGRWLSDGNIEYVGRNDHQVKLRGQRIELGEIEAQLSNHSLVKEAVVIAREDEPGEKRLVAYVTTDGQPLGAEDLRSHLMRRLPQYMVPAAFVQLESLPLTPSRKVDRRALPKPEAQAYASKEYEPPQGKIEETLAGIWQDLLRVERVGRNDNFFELGGHSLSAVQLMAKTNRHFKQMMPLAVLFTAPNIAAFARLLSSEEAPSFEIVVPIQTRGDAPPVFAVPGVGGNVLSLRPLSKVLGDQQPLFALQAVGLDGTTPPLNSVEETAGANIAAMKTVQPRGPYSLIGHSYGGVVAYEMARILLEQGEEVSSLTLLDSIAPSIIQKNPAQDEAAELAEACLAAANLYGVKLAIDVERLRPSSNDDNVQYLAGLLIDCGLEINREQFAAFYRVYRSNQLCYRSYTPQPLSRKVDALLYRATQRRSDRLSLPADYGWDQLLQSPIRASDVEADHFSILEKVSVPGADRIPASVIDA